MKENELMSFEIKAEHIPTAEEIRSIFTLFTNQERIKEDRIIEKNGNLFILEFTVADGQDGATTEYAYKAKRPLEKKALRKMNFPREQFKQPIMIKMVFLFAAIR